MAGGHAFLLKAGDFCSQIHKEGCLAASHQPCYTRFKTEDPEMDEQSINSFPTKPLMTVHAPYTVFDQYTKTFEEVVRLAGIYVDFKLHERPSFTFELGALPALFVVALKCRVPSLRRKAIDLMHRSPGRECTFAARSSGQLASRVVAVEEEDLGLTPPPVSPASTPSSRRHRGVIRVGIRPSSSLQKWVSNAFFQGQKACHMSVTIAVHSAYLLDIAESDFPHICCLIELIRGSVTVGGVAEEVACRRISDQNSGPCADDHADDHDLGIHLRQLLWMMPSLDVQDCDAKRSHLEKGSAFI
ncbi:hypothetical protein AC578_5659 [Pseudocercospora eumusae]|uniref:Uncharacterized protein n=1 Tax=Pseudocercospora eumusae TaxID=321146 RepID=A0A139HTB2_9PEZI|nr:hypothetical protein AC578_5659 [Pseudocercospora eumusae]